MKYLVHSQGTVSYTHLDVYKRQGQSFLKYSCIKGVDDILPLAFIANQVGLFQHI